MIDRSFGSIYFLPCSNSLLGIATSHIGLIRSLYCSVFKEPSLFKRLDYLTTFVEVCQMIFWNLFHRSFERGRFISDGYYLTILPFLCQQVFSCFFEMTLSGCIVSLWLVWRKGFPGFLIEGFPFFAFLTLSALPHTKKISRSARNDGAGRGFTRASSRWAYIYYLLYSRGSVIAFLLSCLKAGPARQMPCRAVLRQLYMYIIIPIRLFHGNCVK